MDQRRIALEQWAIAKIHQIEETSIVANMQPVSGDASFRRYFRLCYLGSSWIAVDAPADKEDNPRFVKVAQNWYKQGISVPKIIAYDFAQGFMLLEDFGSTLLWEPLHAEDVSPQQVSGLYEQAIDQLLEIQSLSASGLPPYNDELLLQEMQLFSHWLCDKLLSIKFGVAEQEMFASCFKLLSEQALKQPKVTVHRDYHSRNLMVREDSSLGIIDFQDAVNGPVTYDLVSLLRDCYVRWPDAKVQELMANYWEKARPLGLYLNDWKCFQKDFDWMGMQRHLKAAGIFARLYIRDGKDGYLKDIPNTCQYILDVSAKYDELAGLHGWLKQHVVPKLASLSLAMNEDQTEQVE